MSNIPFNELPTDPNEILMEKKFKDAVSKLQDKYTEEVKNYRLLLEELEEWFLNQVKEGKEITYQIRGGGYWGTVFHDSQRFALETFKQELLGKGYKSEIKETRDWDKYIGEPNCNYLVLKVTL